MRHSLTGGLMAAAFGAVVMAANALPASAQVGRLQPALANGDASGLLTLVRERENSGGRGGDRILSGNERDNQVFSASRGNARSSNNSANIRVARNNRGNWNHHNWHRRYRGNGVHVGIGFGAPYYAYEPDYFVGDDAVAYCMSRFRSYDPASGTYLGYDGFRHPCP